MTPGEFLDAPGAPPSGDTAAEAEWRLADELLDPLRGAVARLSTKARGRVRSEAVVGGLRDSSACLTAIGTAEELHTKYRQLLDVYTS